MDPAKMVLGWTSVPEVGGVPNRETSVRCVPGRVIRQRDKCRVCHEFVVDVHKSVACPERIVVAAVRMGKVRWGDW